MKKGEHWFQKLIWAMILLTGFYIIYRGSGILTESGGAERLLRVLRSEDTAQVLKELAADTYLPAYQAALEQRKEDTFLQPWLDQLAPVLWNYYKEAQESRKQQESGNLESSTTDGMPGAGGQENGTEALQAGGKPDSGGSAETQMPGERRESEASTDALTPSGQSSKESSEESLPGGQPGEEVSSESLSSGQVGEEGSPKSPFSGQVGEEGSPESLSSGQPGEEMSQESPSSGQAGEEVSPENLSSAQSGEENSSGNPPADTGKEDITDIILEAEQETNPEGTGEESEGRGEEAASLASAIPVETLAQLENFDYLLNHYFVVDSDTVPSENQMNADTLLGHDLTMEKNPAVPQILIYHTHSQEAFSDSVEGDTDTTIIGMGDTLAALLKEKYGYQVIHDTGVYDLVNGVLDRSAAYDYARESITEILEENPTIQVIIDLHRDGVEGQHFVTEINGKQTSRIMFFNGLSRNSSGQSIDYLYNPYTEENLAFSFQLQLAAEQKYPGFTRSIYLKAQRFNLHLRPRSLLIEAGTQLNTVEEERNAMEPLADILNQVLSR